MATLVEPRDLAQPFPLGSPRSVDAAAIERGLAQLWADAGNGPVVDGGGAVVRSCALNFAVVLAPGDHAAQVTETVAALTMRHPCRIFMLTAQPATLPASLDAWVSALCHRLGPGQPHICCEQITLAATGGAVGGLPHLLLALLVPDLPVVVWWRGHAALETPLFDGLSRTADRVLIDSAEADDPAREMQRLAALLARRVPAALADLAWNRLTRWRTLTAQFFDAAESGGYLEHLDRITVEVNGDVAAAEACLWLGWLASRLGWTPQSGRREAQRCVYTFSGRNQVHAEVRRGESTEPYVIHAITLGVSQTPQARFALERRDAHALQASAQAPGIPSLSRIVPMEVREIAAILCDELDVVGHDQVYEEALAVAGRMAAFLTA